MSKIIYLQGGGVAQPTDKCQHTGIDITYSNGKLEIGGRVGPDAVLPCQVSLQELFGGLGITLTDVHDAFNELCRKPQ
jgi:hypothetical protein